jgi:hypothetical protein
MDKSEAKPLKAFIAHDGDEGWSVQYATNGAAARREAAGEFGCDFRDVESCKRAPSLDQYAPGPAPAHALIDIGWSYECGCCGRSVSNDLLEEVEDEGLDPADFEITTRGDWAFCSRTCMGKFDEERRAAKRAMNAAIEAASLRFPFADKIFAHRQGFRDAREVSVWFSFPGGEAPAHWRVGQPTVDIIQKDIPAWHAIAGSRSAQRDS